MTASTPPRVCASATRLFNSARTAANAVGDRQGGNGGLRLAPRNNPPAKKSEQMVLRAFWVRPNSLLFSMFWFLSFTYIGREDRSHISGETKTP